MASVLPVQSRDYKQPGIKDKRMRTKKKTIIKSGDRTYSYIIGEYVTFKWNKRWLIVSSKYDPYTDATRIKLERVYE